MAWAKKRTAVTVGAVILALAVLFAAKKIFFPSVSDSYFQLDSRKLQQAPANILILRPTHFQNSPRKGITYASFTEKSGDSVLRIVGRNVPLEQIFPAAYGSRPSRVVFSPSMPKGNFDFLVTMPDEPEKQLQAAIKNKLGYAAHKEMRDTDVLELKVETPNSPGLKISADDERSGSAFQNGRLNYTHSRVGSITGFLEWNLKQPVLDKTGLTEFYDFSVNWDWRMQRGEFNEDAANKLLNSFGLGLEPGNESIEMLVVEKAY